MARARRVVFSFFWGVCLMVVFGIIGAVYFKTAVDKMRLRYPSESWHQKTLLAKMDKTNKLYTDKFVSFYPSLNVSEAQASVMKPVLKKNTTLTQKQ